MSRVREAFKSRPGEFLAVATIGDLADCATQKSRACLPGYISHLSAELERERISNPEPNGRKSVWGYRLRMAGAKPEDVEVERIEAPMERRALFVDPASRALASPPRGAMQRVPSLCGATYGGKGAA